MSNIEELIRAEIKKLQDIFVETAQGMETEDEATVYSMCAVEFGDELLSFLETLEEPEQPTMGYDEAYLNEKIAKASKSWEGVDVDKFMDEVRGREPVSDCHDLEEVAEKWATTTHFEWPNQVPAGKKGFIAGAEWQKKHMTVTIKQSDLVGISKLKRDEHLY